MTINNLILASLVFIYTTLMSLIALIYCFWLFIYAFVNSLLASLLRNMGIFHDPDRFEVLVIEMVGFPIKNCSTQDRTKQYYS